MILFRTLEQTTFGMVLVWAVFWATPPRELPAQSPTASSGAIDEMLQRRMGGLRIRIDQLHGQIDDLQTRIPQLQDELARLMQEAEALEVTVDPEEAETPPEEEPREVPFRPPLLRYVQKETPLGIVCRDGRVAILDMDACNDALNELLKDSDEVRKLRGGQRARLPAGDFEIVLQVIAIGPLVRIIMEAEARSGQSGELLDDAIRRDSRLAARLGSLDAEDSAIQFVVYPDSFEEFRQVRQFVWERKFSVNWFPISHGEPLLIGAGAGGIGVQ